MSENYKFVQNKKCEFFPCHDVKDKENFNCLFCYCPLYVLKEDCGGDFSYKNGKKDCSKCTIPHTKEGYDHVMSKIKHIIDMAKKDK